MTVESQCIAAEMEYRSWHEAPIWYCVKTTYLEDGTLKSEIAKNEDTGAAIVIQSEEKPLDGVFQTANATVYYTYHQGYEAAAQQLLAATA